MKYCTKCGAQMNDDALFCPKCGTKVEVVEENNVLPIEEEKPAEKKDAPKTNVKVKGQRTPLYEQKVRDILLIPLVIIGCSIAIWIINTVGNLTGVGKIMPLLLFMLFSGLHAAMSMIRAVKTLTRKIYFKSALSFVLFVLLVTCFIIDFVFLVS